MYWPNIRDAVRKEVTNGDTCRCKKIPNKTYGELPAKEAGEMPRNKICVDIIGPYVLRRKFKKENLHLKSATIIDPVTEWFEIAQYDDKRDIYRKIS